MAKHKQIVPVIEKSGDEQRSSKVGELPQRTVAGRKVFDKWGVARANAAMGADGSAKPSTAGGDSAGDKGAAKKKESMSKRLALNVLDSPPVTVIMMVATFWTLIADDIRIATDLAMSHDGGFTVITSVCFFLFAAEVVLSLYAKGSSYYKTPYFYFDIVATVTLVTEMTWLMELGNASNGDNISNTRAVDAARTTRTVRLLRVVRLVRLVRIVKLYRYLMDHLTRHEEDHQKKLSSQAPSWEDNPSAVGRALQESITLQVILGVLIMLVVFPYLSVQEEHLRLDYEVERVIQLDALYRAASEHPSSKAAAAAEALVTHTKDFLHLVYFRLYDGREILNDLSFIPPSVRDSEYRQILAGERCDIEDECSVGGFFVRADNIIQAQYSLYLIAFVMALLFLGVIRFNQISMKYCIAPIEKLFTIVNNFAKDPMQKLESFDEDDSLDELNELERSIRKVASLLQVGIGLAGRDTIARVLRSTGDINPIAVGHKVNCLFGFCDIRQFTDATECLQEQVMLFTNSIGYQVHHAVHDSGGFANKNIGDAFLVAWTGEKLETRIKQVEHAQRNKQIGAMFTDDELTASRSKWTPTIGDDAMAALIRLTIVVRGAPHITELAQNKVLQRRLPGYTVRLGCGLHVGWAIEGALGSQKKIDATYLSPATNIAMALEGATKQYGNLLLISEETFRLFSPFVQKLVRRIDRVHAAPGTEPWMLYTYDLPTTLAVHPDEAQSKALVEHVFDYPLAITPEFREKFHTGLDLYIAGSWAEAKAEFEAAQELLMQQAKSDTNLDAPDKPTIALLKFMGKTDFVAPADWDGSRELE